MIDGVPKKLPPHLYAETTRHGRQVWYVRVGRGKRVRVREAFDTEAFWKAYREAVEGRAGEAQRAADPRNRQGTLAWLIVQYMASSAWTNGIKQATRKQRGAILAAVEQSAGKQLISSITREKIVEGRERRKDRPHAANNFVKAMRALFGWAVENGEKTGVRSDPTHNVSLLSSKNPDGFHSWSEEEAQRYEAKWPLGTRERLAFDLLVYTGLRRGDVVRIGRPHLRNRVLTIRTEKTGQMVAIPVLPPLQASFEATQCGELTFLATSRKDRRPFDKATFGNWFRKACKAAGVPGSAHGLRKLGATRAAENGASEAQLNAIFGWEEGSRESATYVKRASRARRAASAMNLLLPNNPETENPAPPEEVRDSAKIIR